MTSGSNPKYSEHHMKVGWSKHEIHVAVTEIDAVFNGLTEGDNNLRGSNKVLWRISSTRFRSQKSGRL
jgi:hypothetical protein